MMIEAKVVNVTVIREAERSERADRRRDGDVVERRGGEQSFERTTHINVCILHITDGMKFSKLLLSHKRNILLCRH